MATEVIGETIEQCERESYSGLLPCIIMMIFMDIFQYILTDFFSVKLIIPEKETYKQARDKHWVTGKIHTLLSFIAVCIMAPYLYNHEYTCNDMFYKPWIICELILSIVSVPLFLMEFDMRQWEFQNILR